MNPKLKALKNAVGSGIRKVGNFIGKNFIEPSVRVNKIKNEKLLEMKRQAEAGEFN